MKKHGLLKLTAMAILVVFGFSLYAQEDIILDPKDMIPADTGYYIGGVWKDKNGDEIDEFYNGCVDEYGDANHNESSEQFGFTYGGCMIMPTCWPKDAVADHGLAEIDHAEGYIQLTRTWYPNTDSAVLGYILSPPIENLQSLTLETSPDVTPLDTRHIYFWLEYSKDFGSTWENAYIQDETLSKKGDTRTYDGSVYLEFEEMKTASTESPIVIRILTAPQPESYPQRLKIHYIKLVADKVNSIDKVKPDDPIFRVIDNVIYAENGSIEVFSILGRFMGSGNSIAVPEGIYIVKTSGGRISKVLVNY